MKPVVWLIVWPTTNDSQTWFLDFIFWLPLQYPPIDGWIPHDITNMEELGFKEDAPQAEVEVTAKILRVL